MALKLNDSISPIIQVSFTSLISKEICEKNCFFHSRNDSIFFKKTISSSSSFLSSSLPPIHFFIKNKNIINKRRSAVYFSKKFEPIQHDAMDDELFSVLELASDEEINELCNILYGRSLFSPLVKSFDFQPFKRSTYSNSDSEFEFDFDFESEEAANLRTQKLTLEEREKKKRTFFLKRLEARFFYLASNSKEIIRGNRPTYHQVLILVCKKLKITKMDYFSAMDLEAEIFLHLLRTWTHSEMEGNDSGVDEKSNYNITHANQNIYKNGLLSGLKMGANELFSLAARGISTVAISALEKKVLQNISGKVLLESARYNVAKESLKTGAKLFSSRFDAHLALLSAQKGLLGASARYITLRNIMNILGPIMWGTLLAELAIKSIGVDYSRIIRAIFLLAQIRLTNTYGWQSSDS